MEMNEGYQDREDPGLTVRFPLLDRPGESLLVWTTTPWTLTVQRRRRGRRGPALRPGPPGRRPLLAGQGHAQDARSRTVRGRGGGRRVRARRLALRGPVRRRCRPFARRSRPGRAMTRRRLPASRRRLGRGRRGRGDRHRPHRPRLRRRGLPAGQGLGLPIVAPLDESGHRPRGFGSLTGRDVRDVAEPIVEHLKREGRFYRLEPYLHRYPHCWRCGTPLRLPPRRRVVHQHGPGLRPAARDADDRAGRREPALPDHGGRRPHPLDPRFRATNASSTGSATCTTG